MSCPPGTILNPRTLRCVKVSGRKAQELAKHGNIPEYYVQQPQPAYTAFLFGKSPRQTRRNVRRPNYYGVQQQQPFFRTPTACPPGQERNPTTGRCIKLGGKTHKRLHPQPQPVYQPPLFQKQLPQKEVRRRTESEAPTALPVGTAGIAPLADRATILGWAHAHCKNDRDPITGIPFVSAEAAALQDLIRLHNRTCTMAGPLNAKVSVEHKAGQVATIPGQTDHMTLDDFKALRDSMRRRDPSYKLPGRRHQPPPSTWQLYIASDNRSGPDFASILFVDTTKVVQGPAGPEYPVESVKMDLGFIPANITGALCAPQLVVELIQRLAAANRLLTPVAGGWKPVAGFPYSKQYWSGSDAKERFGKLCRELTRAVASPL